MSRHRKVKALDYDDEYDDYYGEYDDDIDEDAFEAQYLSSGIDLNASDGNNISSNKFKQTISDKIEPNTIDSEASSSSNDNEKVPGVIIKSSTSLTESTEQKSPIEFVSSDLTRLAIQHLDKHQWQLPLMEMDKKFRDKTYYKHYTDTYLSSLRSKLGHFLADNQLITNPMRYHMQQELDNYSKYSRIFELLTDYYQSLGSGFFSFATPSPDEEIVIGCRLGTKGYYRHNYSLILELSSPSSCHLIYFCCCLFHPHKFYLKINRDYVKLTHLPTRAFRLHSAKKQVSKQNQPDKLVAAQKTARFEFQGNNNATQPSTSKPIDKKSTKPKAPKPQAQCKLSQPKDLTIREDFTREQLDTLSRNYHNSLNIEANKTKSTNQPITKQQASTSTTTKKLPKAVQQPKQLETLVEKRQNLKKQLKLNTEPSAQDRETFKRQSIQTAKEYNDSVKSCRPRVNLVVVGHVDAGKSTLVGHLLYKLGQISGKQMHRIEVDSQRQGKASFKFAWAMDETSEERARGVTIDIALTKFETPHREVTLLDAPGHVDFIPAVISGAAQADAALLVVDATRGEFETGFMAGGQTREHTFLVRSLGVKSLIVVVNKMDNVNWNWARFGDIVDQLKPFLKLVGFNLLEDVQFVVCSGLTGDNLVERRIDKTLKASSHPQLEGDGGNWGSVPSLLEAIDKIRQPERMVEKPVRVCVTDVFKGMSSGVFLGAKVVSGKLEPKQKLLLLPPGETCEIKQVEVRDSKAQRAFAGDIVTTVATGIDMNQYYRGCILSDPLIPCQVTNRFQARIVMFQNASSIIIKGTPIEVHINGTFECGEVRRLISLLNKSTGELVQRKPRCLSKNSSAIIQLKLSRVVCCELFEDNKDLGRFMMRSYGKTIAAGLITKIKSPKVEKTKLKSKS